MEEDLRQFRVDMLEIRQGIQVLKERTIPPRLMTGIVTGSPGTALPGYVKVNPVSFGGDAPSEGGTATVNAATRTVLVAVLGPKMPAVGDTIVCKAVGGRWVAETCCLASSGCEGKCVLPCAVCGGIRLVDDGVGATISDANGTWTFFKGFNEDAGIYGLITGDGTSNHPYQSFVTDQTRFGDFFDELCLVRRNPVYYFYQLGCADDRFSLAVWTYPIDDCPTQPGQFWAYDTGGSATEPRIGGVSFSASAAPTSCESGSLVVEFTIGAAVIVHTGTATAGGFQDITLDADASGVSESYDDYIITITGGTGAGQTRVIISYDGPSKVAEVDAPWDVIPDNTSTFEVATQDHTHGVLPPSGTATLTVDAMVVPKPIMCAHFIAEFVLSDGETFPLDGVTISIYDGEGGTLLATGVTAPATPLSDPSGHVFLYWTGSPGTYWLTATYSDPSVFPPVAYSVNIDCSDVIIVIPCSAKFVLTACGDPQSLKTIRILDSQGNEIAHGVTQLFTGVVDIRVPLPTVDGTLRAVVGDPPSRFDAIDQQLTTWTTCNGGTIPLAYPVSSDYICPPCLNSVL